VLVSRWWCAGMGLFVSGFTTAVSCPLLSSISNAPQFFALRFFDCLSLNASFSSFFALRFATVVGTRMFLSFSYPLLSLFSSVTADGQTAVSFLFLLTTAMSHPACWRGPPDSNHGIPCPVAVAVAPAAPAAPAPARPCRTKLGQQVRPALRRAGVAARPASARAAPAPGAPRAPRERRKAALLCERSVRPEDEQLQRPAPRGE